MLHLLLLLRTILVWEEAPLWPACSQPMQLSLRARQTLPEIRVRLEARSISTSMPKPVLLLFTNLPTGVVRRPSEDQLLEWALEAAIRMDILPLDR